MSQLYWSRRIVAGKFLFSSPPTPSNPIPDDVLNTDLRRIEHQPIGNGVANCVVGLTLDCGNHDIQSATCSVYRNFVWTCAVGAAVIAADFANARKIGLKVSTECLCPLTEFLRTIASAGIP